MLVFDVGMHNPRAWTFISDKQKGLVESIHTVCEGAEHRCCARHLYSNFTLSHKGLTLKVAARATTVPEWRTVMNDIKDASEESAQWSRSHFQDHSKCDILLNNLCEAFNSSILVAREKPILSMLEKIRHQHMLKMNAKREAAEKWDHRFGPRIMNIIEQAKSNARFLKADYAGPEKFEVSSRDGMRLGVDSMKNECACRRWQLTSIPCQHAIAGMLSRNIGILDYVDVCYQKMGYLRSYTPVIQPMSGPELWRELGKHPLNPPANRKQARRPKKLRKRSQIELLAGVKMGRSGMKTTCRRCGDAGHNKRTCRDNLPTDQPSQAQSQPSQPQSQPQLSHQKKRESTSKKSKEKGTN
ncbi:uncharacterized protein LOC111394305 [Olea europaea var. sylvestris]|uniref:uncharacterized protein LOC111394305 n=1 Tax=Olea europaea var. sylvestris TaxID=158386 RepID=UPI000C1CF8B3|nr:uncharacterized protein LOC111394305 [Olea europaea var. sylvestris]